MIKQFITLSLLLFCVSAVYATENDILNDIESSARSWLALTDKGLYTESWKKSSTYLQEKKSESEWIKTVKAFRKPLGLMKTRHIAAAGYKQGLSGFPKGEYVAIQFYTTFTNQTLALETITLVKDKHESWRVADYIVK